MIDYKKFTVHVQSNAVSMQRCAMSASDMKKINMSMLPLKVTAIYALTGAAWIFFSDATLSYLVRDPNIIMEIAVFKGWLFVAITASLLYAVLRRNLIIIKRNEDVLRNSEERYRAIFECGNSINFISDPQTGEIIDANQVACEFYGYSRAELLSLKVWDINMLPREKILETIHKAALRPNSRFEFKHRLASGEIRDVEVFAGPFVQDGKTLLFSVIHDISERKKMEEELTKAHKLDSLGILAGGIAHDFNNILTGIMGNISLAKMIVGPSHEVYDRLKDAEKSSRRASELTRQLLTFAKGGEPVRKPLALQRTINESAKSALIGSNVAYTLALPESLWDISADEGQLNQVFINLIINARQAMPDGGTIVVSAENHTIDGGADGPVKPGNYVKIRITDKGCGIEPGNLAKIFDPFFSTKAQGTGLGLALAHSIIKKHGGHISVTSQVGTGTTFTLHLPAHTYDVPQEKHHPVESPVPGKASGKILVMDDEETVREIAAKILAHLGYAVTGCPDGADAIALYAAEKERGEPFDAVIMDLTIPGGMGGREALAKLRGVDPGVKAIVSSGYSNDPVVANFGEYGFNGVVTKPYSVEILGKALSEVLQDKTG